MRNARALYFAYYAAMAAVLPYLTLYYQSLGLSGSQIGLLTGLMPLVMLVGAPLWAEFADATGRNRLVLWVAIGASIVLAVGLSVAGSFVPLTVLVALFALSIAPIMPLVDHAVLEALGDRTEAYGRQRIWGAYGWGICAPLAGLITQRFGLPWMFALYVAAMAVALVAAYGVPVHVATGRRRFGVGVAAMLEDARWITFLFAVFVGGVSLSVSINFLPLYLRGIGSSLTLIGLAVTVATVSELPVMAFGGALLAWLGARRMLIGALLAWMLRLALYPLIATPLLILPVQLLHGASFAAMWIAGVAYARHLAPRGAGAAAQGLFTGVTVGLGGLVGGLFGGFTLERLGPSWMFGTVSMLSLVAAVLLWRSGSDARPM